MSDKWAAAARAAEQGRGGNQRPQEFKQSYDDPEWLEEKTFQVRQESLSTTQRALRRLNEAEELAQNNLSQLNMQTEQLHKMEQKLDSAETHAKISDAKADRLKALNRFFMIPAFGSKAAKRKEEKYQQKMQMEIKGKKAQEREAEWEQRQKNVQQYERHISRPSSSRAGKMYTTPVGVERDEIETEIDSNLRDISSGLSRLKMMGQAMNQEMNYQSGQLDRIQDRSEDASERFVRLNQKMNKLTKK